MAKRKAKAHPVVQIDWCDAWGSASWMPIAEAKEHYNAGAPCRSVGFLLDENKDGFLLAGTIGEKDVNAMFFIPRAWAKAVKRG